MTSHCVPLPYSMLHWGTQYHALFWPCNDRDKFEGKLQVTWEQKNALYIFPVLLKLRNVFYRYPTARNKKKNFVSYTLKSNHRLKTFAKILPVTFLYYEARVPQSILQNCSLKHLTFILTKLYHPSSSSLVQSTLDLTHKHRHARRARVIFWWTERFWR